MTAPAAGARDDRRGGLEALDLAAEHERDSAQTEHEDQRARDQSAPQVKSRRETPPVDTAGAPTYDPISKWGKP
ncbi:MAG: hypothetical protein AUH30_04640 [Candidatus Rokubacteria bacterium 13_1_40CM_68_15]|nr:MAG: hypothetical protein AUH30_04640 [Candidatus Rokubacteria bacterium 13_1_40CM_68_15]